MDPEATLQVFRISTDDTIEVVLDSEDPLQKYEIYNICFVKDDKLVQPNGKVKVYVPIPEGMDGNTCKIYRQEADGGWTVLDAWIEGDYLVFETDHFSLYVVVGDEAKLNVYSLPSITSYSKGDILNTEGLVLDINGELVTSGFICEPTVLTECGEQKITVKLGHSATEFTVTVSSDSQINLGDVDGDGNIDATDALAVLKHAAKLKILTELTIADVTNDNNVDAADALMILKYAAKIIDGFESSTATKAPIFTALSTETVKPTETVTPKPTATPTPKPTATPTPTATLIPVVTATPSPIPVVTVTPSNVPTDIFGYTVLEDGTASITDYYGDSKDVFIPKVVDGYKVTDISARAFKDNTSIQLVYIPDSVTSIGNYAFSECTNLRKVILKEGVTNIGSGAFYKCSDLWYIVLPESVVNIGTLAFCHCRSLEKIKIPSTLTTISYGMFSFCSSLSSISIPANVIGIDELAFKGCSNLSSITIPSSVTMIGDNVFKDCDNVTIYGYDNSYAEQYAKGKNITFISLNES